MAWFGFWIFLSVLVIVDAWLYSKGHSCLIFDHTSDHEKRLREAAVAQAERAAHQATKEPSK